MGLTKNELRITAKSNRGTLIGGYNNQTKKQLRHYNLPVAINIDGVLGDN